MSASSGLELGRTSVHTEYARKACAQRLEDGCGLVPGVEVVGVVQKQGRCDEGAGNEEGRREALSAFRSMMYSEY
jgi:hypothetical protein